MSNSTGPTRFDPRRIFLGTGWNVFVLVAGSIGLWGTLARWAIAYHAPGWWPDVAWAFLCMVLLHALWTSARRLWQARKGA